MIRNSSLAFIPIFIAVDAIGVLPIFVSLTQGIAEYKRSRLSIAVMMIRKGMIQFFN